MKRLSIQTMPLKTVVFAALFALAGCSVEGNLGTEPPLESDSQTGLDSDPGGVGQGDVYYDSDSESDTYPWGKEDTAWDWNWDTGEGPKVCQGEWLTGVECQALNGSFDLSFVGFECIDGLQHRCCLPDTLANPCPFECAGAADCQDRGGNVTDWGLGYQCPAWSYKCCEGAAPADTDSANYWEPPFDPVACPFETETDTDSDPYDMYYRPTAADQPSKLASGVCMGMPMFQEQDETTPYFCPQEIYDRIEREIEQIKILYPVTAADVGGQIYNGFGDMKEPFVMLCVPGVYIPSNCHDFPKDGFQELMQCYGGTYEDCLFEGEQSCGQAHMKYSVAANTLKMLDAYQQHANGLVPGSVCELNAYMGVGGSIDLNGFHITEVSPDGETWIWTVRTTSTFQLSVVHCDVTFRLYSQPDPLDPDASIVRLLSENPPSIDNNSTTFCQDPIFQSAGQ